jgi:hypothetical protein
LPAGITNTSAFYLFLQQLSYNLLLHSYSPPLLPLSFTLFLSSEPLPTPSKFDGRDIIAEWQKILPQSQFTSVAILGNHISMMTDPSNRAQLASAISNTLMYSTSDPAETGTSAMIQPPAASRRRHAAKT